MEKAYRISPAAIAWATRQQQHGINPSHLKELIIKQKGRCALSGAPLYFDEKYGPDINGQGCHPLYAEVDYTIGKPPDYYRQIVCSQLNRLKDSIVSFGEIPLTPAWAKLMKKWKAQAEKDPMDIEALSELAAGELAIEEEKVRPEDLVKALKRSKMYQDDYKHIAKEKLCRKYDLRYPINPGDPFCSELAAGELAIEEEKVRPEEDISHIRSAVALFSYPEFRHRLKGNTRLMRITRVRANLRFSSNPRLRGNPRFKGNPRPMRITRFRANLRFSSNPRLRGNPRFKGNPRLRAVVDEILRELAVYQDRRLLVFIDTDVTRDQIKPEFNRILNDWIKTHKKRNKESGVDIWKVYDLREQGKPFTEIAKSLLKSEKSPTASANAEAEYKQITRAYDKAKKYIKQIEFKAINTRLDE